VKEMLIEFGMNDFLSKPIIRSELTFILKKWIPAEKIISQSDLMITTDQTEIEKNNKFWMNVEQIEELSVSIGLDIVSGQKDIYKKSLKLLIDEIEKCVRNLNDFLEAKDMLNFCIEAHGIKGSLANIGAMNLSANARDLEMASHQEDIIFCTENFPDFKERLNDLSFKLKEAFAEIKSSHAKIEIPPELQLIFERLKNAFDEMNFVAIDNEIENMESLNLGDALKEETEQIKDAVLIMDYEGAKAVIQKLLSDSQVE